MAKEQPKNTKSTQSTGTTQPPAPALFADPDQVQVISRSVTPGQYKAGQVLARNDSGHLTTYKPGMSAVAVMHDDVTIDGNTSQDTPVIISGKVTQAALVDADEAALKQLKSRNLIAQ